MARCPPPVQVFEPQLGPGCPLSPRWWQWGGHVSLKPCSLWKGSLGTALEESSLCFLCFWGGGGRAAGGLSLEPGTCGPEPCPCRLKNCGEEGTAVHSTGPKCGGGLLSQARRNLAGQRAPRCCSRCVLGEEIPAGAGDPFLPAGCALSQGARGGRETRRVLTLPGLC